nr:AAA family ATPase [Shewanella intestini]
MQHLASYGDHLSVLCGPSGSGKTTLATVLATELTHYNSALVLCPKHVDAAEIRRKVLVQLINSPIFDDEVPLMDTVLKIQSSLQKPLHIIIDDAHLLPMEIWAECILLSQIKCAGKYVTVTLTCEPEHWALLSQQLNKQLRNELLQVDIEPLYISEREGLYQTLLSRSGQTPFIPREIVRAKLEKQTGTPQEVLQLLSLALSPQEEVIASWRKWLKPIASFMVALVVIAGIVAGYEHLTLQSSTLEPSTLQAQAGLTVQQTLAKKQASEAIKQWANDYLAACHFCIGNQLAEAADNQQRSINSQAHLSRIKAVSRQLSGHASRKYDVDILTVLRPPHPQKLGLSSLFTPKNTHDIEALIKQYSDTHHQDKVKPASVELPQPVSTIESDKEPNKTSTPTQASIIEPRNDINEVDLQTPVDGYTLQLASVSKRQSLQPYLSKLAAEENVYLREYKSKYILLIGQYHSAVEAEKTAKKLQAKYGLSAPWIRKWQDLSQYKVSVNLS